MNTHNEFDIQIASSVDEVGITAWDALSSGRPFQSARWYAYGETVLADSSPIYIVLSHSGEPVARATCWLKRQEWLPITSPVMRFGAERLLERWPLLACETPLACVSGLILPESPQRAAALETIAHIAWEWAKKNHASFALFSYINRHEARQAGWPKAFSAVSYSDAETTLDIIWPDFESYLKHLAKSTRRNFRLHCKQAAALALVITTQPSVSDVDQALTLIQNVEAYHRVGHRPWARAMLENAHMVDSLWISARIENRLVGCCSLIGDGDAQIATLLGLDYSFSQFIYVYYQIIYAAIRCAMERGAKVLYGGGGAYELKRRLGFHMMPDDYLVVTATGQLIQWLLHGLARRLELQKADEKVSDIPDDLC
jgi:predicted N-acyltransferase